MGADGFALRQVLGRFATGVTVVTGADEAKPLGLAVNSFTSISLDPPLVGFCVNRASSTWPRIRVSGSFCVNVLGAPQEALSRTFALAGHDRFAGVQWHPSPSGAPLLDGVIAWIDCAVFAEHPAGDHLIVIGQVRNLGVGDGDEPLVFYRGDYGRFTR